MMSILVGKVPLIVSLGATTRVRRVQFQPPMLRAVDRNQTWTFAFRHKTFGAFMQSYDLWHAVIGTLPQTLKGQP